MNCLSFSLFGYQNQNLTGAFPFASYFRGLSFNIKMCELLYPGWVCYLTLDRPTYDAFKEYFDYHASDGILILDIVEPDELCKMMLTRLRPVFVDKCDRVLCRDLDSLTSYKERQAVEYWISTGRIAHAITDSVSHNISLMGGMVGFQCEQFRQIMGVNNFEQLLYLGRRIDYTIKGADQTFLNQVVLPNVADPNNPTIVEHYLLGRPQSFRGECYDYVQPMEIDGVNPEMETESNKLIEHIGADGFRCDQSLMFYDKYMSPERLEYHAKIEDQFKEVFYWRNEI